LAGAVLALAVVFAGPMATMGFVGRLPAMGFDVETHIFFVSWVVLANIASILAFAIFVLAGILLRHRPEVHKRLMLLATLCIIGPPLARIANWPVFSWIEEIPFVIAGSLILLATLAIYDFVANRRLHTVTLAGGLFSVLIILAPPVIANAGFAHSFVRGMG
jgi:hypothetical protein